MDALKKIEGFFAEIRAAGAIPIAADGHMATDENWQGLDGRRVVYVAGGMTMYCLDAATGALSPWGKIALPIDTSAIVAEQVRFASTDGTTVPMFLVHHKDATPDGDRPVYLTGYGGFNVSAQPGFVSSRSSWAAHAVWIEHGGVVAIPNLRGGGEYGETWHQAGMRQHKQQVFDDFLSAARWLIDHKWTRAGRLAIAGGSNGGLLVGAVVIHVVERAGRARGQVQVVAAGLVVGVEPQLAEHQAVARDAPALVARHKAVQVDQRHVGHHALADDGDLVVPVGVVDDRELGNVGGGPGEYYCLEDGTHVYTDKARLGMLLRKYSDEELKEMFSSFAGYQVDIVDADSRFMVATK